MGATAFNDVADDAVRVNRQPVGPAIRGVRLPHDELVNQGLSFGSRDLFALVRTSGDGQVVRVLPMPGVRVLSVSTDREVYESGARVHVLAPSTRPGPPSVGSCPSLHVRSARRTVGSWPEAARTGSATSAPRCRSRSAHAWS